MYEEKSLVRIVGDVAGLPRASLPSSPSYSQPQITFAAPGDIGDEENFTISAAASGYNKRRWSDVLESMTEEELAELGHLAIENTKLITTSKPERL